MFHSSETPGQGVFGRYMEQTQPIRKQIRLFFQVQPIAAMSCLGIAARAIAEMAHLDRRATVGKSAQSPSTTGAGVA
jgi:hypothetical protein